MKHPFFFELEVLQIYFTKKSRFITFADRAVEVKNGIVNELIM